MKYVLILSLTYFFLNIYKSIAIRKKIFSLESKRTLHKGKIPRGGGFIFALIFLIFFKSSFMIEQNYTENVLILILLMFASTLLGFIDDIFDIKINIKFFCQLLISIILVYSFLNPFSEIYLLFLFILSVFLVLWSLNIANFLDGIDGYLTSISIIVSVMLLTLLNLQGITHFNFFILSFISVLVIFLYFNWSPAQIFMGDSGSLFIGTYFCILNMLLIKNDLVGILTLIIIFSYSITETTATLFIRTFLGINWRKTHRSHGYQNLARIWESHSKVTLCTIVFHLAILFPFALISYFYNFYAYYLALISIILSSIFVYKFGPTISSD